MTFKATCCCKQLSITVSSHPEINSVCHCNNCKQRTGSAFGISMYFKTGAIINKTGETKVYKFFHKEQSHEQCRYFCPQCGTTLYWTISTMPDLLGIAGGCFSASDILEPTHTLNNANKCSWVNFPSKWHVQE